MITIIDYSLGNLFSIQRSLAYLGLDSVISGDPDAIAAADRLILPGVGAFRDAARLLSSRGLGDAVRRSAARGTPLLGICLGMQVLFERSFEDGVHDGLGLLKGEIRGIREDLPVPLKVPHIGWNALRIVKSTPLTRSVREGDHVYYVHSYYAAACGDVCYRGLGIRHRHPRHCGAGQCVRVPVPPGKERECGVGCPQGVCGGEPMILFPAIDLLGGRVVRLREGDFARVTDYPDDPAALAQRYFAGGARFLHVVDLDGAREGTQANFDAIRRIRMVTGLYIQAGGGARDEGSVARYLALGVDRVIIGSAAVTDPAFLERMAGVYPGKIAAGVDAKGGYAAIHGWKEVTAVRALDLLERLPGMGVPIAIYTDIARDGMMAGANLQAYRDTLGIKGLNVIASGGVSTLADIKALTGMGLHGAIVGKALLGGTLSLKDALASAEGKE